MTTFLVLAIALIILNILDIVTTHNAIKSGKGVEGNPVMAWVMKVFGAAWWAPKLVIIAVAIFSLHQAQTSNLAIPALVLLVIAYTYVVYSNYKIWRGSK